MNLSNITPAMGSVKTNKRLGRGTGSGKGGTSIVTGKQIGRAHV